jgi:hypothetical protein
MLHLPRVNTPGTERNFYRRGRIWREEKGVFLLSFNRSKVRHITMGKSRSKKLGEYCKPKAGTLELQENSLEKPRRERDRSDGHG